MRNKNTDGAVTVAQLALQRALRILNSYEDDDEQIQEAADHIRDVLDQLCHHCAKHLKLDGLKRPDVNTNK